MGPKERIITIRLIEKLQMHPNYGKALGIEGTALKATCKEGKT